MTVTRGSCRRSGRIGFLAGRHELDVERVALRDADDGRLLVLVRRSYRAGRVTERPTRAAVDPAAFGQVQVEQGVVRARHALDSHHLLARPLRRTGVAYRHSSPCPAYRAVLM